MCAGAVLDSFMSSGEGEVVEVEMYEGMSGEIVDCWQASCLLAGCSVFSRLALICIAALLCLSFHASQPLLPLFPLFPLLDFFVLFPPPLVALLLPELRLSDPMMDDESVCKI